MEHHVWLRVYQYLCVFTGTSAIVLMIELKISHIYWIVPVFCYLTTILAIVFAMDVRAVRKTIMAPISVEQGGKLYGTYVNPKTITIELT